MFGSPGKVIIVKNLVTSIHIIHNLFSIYLKTFDTRFLNNWTGGLLNIQEVLLSTNPMFYEGHLPELAGPQSERLTLLKDGKEKS